MSSLDINVLNEKEKRKSQTKAKKKGTRIFRISARITLLLHLAKKNYPRNNKCSTI